VQCLLGHPSRTAARLAVWTCISTEHCCPLAVAIERWYSTGCEAVFLQCRGKAAVGVSMWMRVLLPQVLGPGSGAFPSDGDEISSAAISRLSNSGAAAALDMLDIAMAPGGANASQAQHTCGPVSLSILLIITEAVKDLCTLLRTCNSFPRNFRLMSLLPIAKCYYPCGFRVSYIVAWQAV